MKQKTQKTLQEAYTHIAKQIINETDLYNTAKLQSSYYKANLYSRLSVTIFDEREEKMCILLIIYKMMVFHILDGDLGCGSNFTQKVSIRDLTHAGN